MIIVITVTIIERWASLVWVDCDDRTEPDGEFLQTDRYIYFKRVSNRFTESRVGLPTHTHAHTHYNLSVPYKTMRP